MKKLLAFLMVLFFAAALGTAFAAPAQASMKSEVKKAYSQLNKFRTTKKVWVWKKGSKSKKYYNTNSHNRLRKLKKNKKLVKTAKKRVKELAKVYDHVRPNGKICFTAYPEMSAYGENIAYIWNNSGFDVAPIMDMWKETKCKYNGQGHRRNMLRKDFNAVGIAAYKKDGFVYWIQCFGRI